jgi:hypothetical protein
MSTIFILLFFATLIASVVCLIKFIINLIKKKPAKRKFIFSISFLVISFVCFALFGITMDSEISKQKKEQKEFGLNEAEPKENDQESISSPNEIDKKNNQFIEKKRKIEEKAFNKGMNYFNKGKFRKAYKQFSKIPKSSDFYESTKMYLEISKNEQNLKRIAKRYVKSDKANLRLLPQKNAPIDTVLTKNTDLYLCYTYGNWSRIYREKEDNWLFPDVRELNGWIHSSLLEDEAEYENRKEKEAQIEEQKRNEQKAEIQSKFYSWQVQYFLNAPEFVQGFEPMWIETNMLGIKMYVTSLNKIMIENAGIDVAYALQKYFGSDIRIHIFINVGHSEIAEVEWSIWNNRFECKFKK